MARSRRKKSLPEHLRGQLDWPADLDPAEFLSVYEQRAAELYLRCAQAVPTGPSATAADRLAYAQSVHEAWPTVFGRPLDPREERRLQRHPAFLAYCRQLGQQVGQRVLQRLEAYGYHAVDNFLWAQDQARAEGDYKETRLAAADHLDRLGATKHPGANAPSLVIVLKGGLDSLHQHLPTLEAELVVNAEEVA